MRSRYALASETPVYFHEAIPACKSAMVSSSSSNAGGALVEALAGDVSLAAAVTLTVARPMLPAMLWRTKLLRFMPNLAFVSEARAQARAMNRIQSVFLKPSPPLPLPPSGAAPLGTPGRAFGNVGNDRTTALLC